MPTPNHNWTDLARSIQKGRAILVLGPEAVAMSRNGQRVLLQTLLSEHLTATLKRRDPEGTLIANPSLAYLAKTLEDTIFVQERQKRPSFSEENARTALYTDIADFYAQYTFSDFPVYRQLAQMPLRFMVETAAAPYLAQAMDGENKFDTKCFYYHYANPTHKPEIPDHIYHPVTCSFKGRIKNKHKSHLSS